MLCYCRNQSIGTVRVRRSMCLVKECSHKIKIEFEEIKRTATVKKLHLFCFDEAFTHQVECIYVSDSHTVELKCMSLPLSLSFLQTKLNAFMFLTFTLSN